MFWSLWFLSFYFSAITLITSVCLVFLWLCVPVHTAVFLFFTYVCMIYVCLSIFLCVCVYMCLCIVPLPPILPPTRVPGGECRQWGRAGGRGHPRDQCDRRGRRANAQRRLPAATPWRPRPVRWRNVGRRLRGQPGPPRSWLRHAGSGGQEAEVCEANGGEWGFWVSLHREEPVLRPCPSFPLPHSWGNLGNRVWGRGLKSCMMTCPSYLFALGSTILFLPNCTIPLICLSNVIHSFTLSFVVQASSRRSPAESPLKSH